MTLQQQAEAFFFIVLAGLLSMIVGLDRERQDHPAGLRTHMLVGIGACIFTILSRYAFGSDADSSRIASQILPGLGFLGAGAILKERKRIRGLTTAASMWATAAIGMAVGAGAWFLALAGTLTIYFVLVFLHRFERQVLNTKGGVYDEDGDFEPDAAQHEDLTDNYGTPVSATQRAETK